MATKLASTKSTTPTSNSSTEKGSKEKDQRRRKTTSIAAHSTEVDDASTTSTTAHAIGASRTPTTPRRCHFCSETDHMIRDCPLRRDALEMLKARQGAGNA
ncbi:hypothetical protein BJ508DRAFT_335526 [Ascobolus immersus RN42]|uniref:CCHC-type domain-containing protein n=1 Tax=Ascobolus immersus RN42 TaxID=1160509 RepID=A0A3N4HQL6_ASCIM|nr:hypothetical protein BJ508DRAFT_335526 [Ascobolus immersus RN42]